MNTIPEDGSADDFPASSRLVRDLVAAHPNEDLVICVAGCNPVRDRVIYSQPADPLAAKTHVAKTESGQVAPAALEPVGDSDSKAAPPAAADAKAPAAAEPSDERAPPSDSATAKPAESESHMEPTAAEPEASSESADEPASESGSDEAPDERDPTRDRHRDAGSDAPAGETSE
ncbi:MAG TPA: hypothetical protein PKD49_06895 [Hyphomicrobium sp.]|nr:hypothetical protein [Hyphomicrobium sp.]